MGLRTQGLSPVLTPGGSSRSAWVLIGVCALTLCVNVTQRPAGREMRLAGTGTLAGGDVSEKTFHPTFAVSFFKLIFIDLREKK